MKGNSNYNHVKGLQWVLKIDVYRYVSIYEKCRWLNPLKGIVILKDIERAYLIQVRYFEALYIV